MTRPVVTREMGERVATPPEQPAATNSRPPSDHSHPLTVDELLKNVLSRLKDRKPSGDGWTARCPAHDDQHPSLSINISTARDKVLLTCHAGCTAEQVVAAIDLTMADLFVNPLGKTPKNGRKCEPEIYYDYRDEAGIRLYQVVRKPGKEFCQRRQDSTTGKWIWNVKGIRRVIYRLPEIMRADASQTVFVVEGEKDVESLVKRGQLATTNTGGAGKWTEGLSPSLKGRHVVILPDNDSPGLNHAEDVQRKLARYAASVQILHLEGLPEKGDITDWFALGHTVDELLKLVPPRPPSANGQPCTGEVEGLATTSLADIKPVPVRWLVPGVIPLGKLVLLAGDGGHGKSTTVCDLSACITTGRPAFGMDYPTPASGEVLLINCEDDFADTIVPRLLSAGADLSKIRKVDGVRLKDRKGKPIPFCLADYEAMEKELTQRPGVRFVVVDPAGAYIGRSGVDDHKDAELRSLLGPMSDLAASLGVTILLVKHLSKGAGVKAVQRVGGSAGYVNAVRAAFMLLPDKDDEAIKLLLPIKFNVGPKPQGVKFRMAGLGPEDQGRIVNTFAAHLNATDQGDLAGQLFRIQWEGFTDEDADDVLASSSGKEGGRKGATAKAVEWIRAYLGKYAYPDDEVKEAILVEGYTFNNFKFAKLLLREQGELTTTKRGFSGKWWVGLGPAHQWQIRPDPDAVAWPAPPEPLPE